jgi:plastocyanin
MKKLLLLAVAVPVFALTPAFAATKGVDITRAGFTPSKVTIDFGDTVTSTNKDTNPHQVLADQAKFPTSPVLQANQTYSYTFMKSGNFAYRDALATNHRGTVTVRAGVSIGAAPPSVKYGSTTTLSGVVSNATAGEVVTVDAQACGQTTFTRIATLTSAANGAWTYAAKPTLDTLFQANWKSAKSMPARVVVRPRLVLKKTGRGRFSATVSAAQSLVGKYIDLQRRTRSGWSVVKRVTLRTATGTTPPTINSSARFRARVRRGTKLRLVMLQPGTCYAPATSNTIRA